MIELENIGSVARFDLSLPRSPTIGACGTFGKQMELYGRGAAAGGGGGGGEGARKEAETGLEGRLLRFWAVFPDFPQYLWIFWGVE